MSTSELISTDPCTGAVVWRGEAAGPLQVDHAVRRARAAAIDWAATPIDQRRSVALAFADLVKKDRDPLARLVSLETGKPLWEALTEVDSVAAKIAISIRAQDARAGETSADMAPGLQQAVRHRPHGVLAVLGPFNFPMHLPNGHIAPALLAGNAVIFKPSEKTPATGVRMGEIWNEAGLPEGVLQVVTGDGRAGQALAAHDDIDGILFTGSVETGEKLLRASVLHPGKILALELGGNNPLVAWDVEAPETAAHLIVQSAFVSAGQRCSCARRLIVPQGTAGDPIIEALVGLMDRLRVGSPFDEPQPFSGPVIDNLAADMLVSAQARLGAAGAQIIRPLHRRDLALPFLQPALIDVTDVPNRVDEEYFGPILQVIRTASFDEAIAEAARTRFGLAAGLIGGSRSDYDRFWQRSRAGIVNWNRPTTGASSSAPFGGIGASGNHRPSAFYAADYCAYPVASLEAEAVDFRIETGLSSDRAAA